MGQEELVSIKAIRLFGDPVQYGEGRAAQPGRAAGGGPDELPRRLDGRPMG